MTTTIAWKLDVEQFAIRLDGVQKVRANRVSRKMSSGRGIKPDCGKINLKFAAILGDCLIFHVSSRVLRDLLVYNNGIPCFICLKHLHGVY